MKIKTPLLAIMLLLAFTITAMAQDEDDEESEKWRNFEVYLSGGLAMPSGTLSDWNTNLGANTGFNIGLAGGYYFTNNICIGTYLTYTQFSIEDYELRHRIYNAGFYGKYAFVGESNFEPYVKATVGSVWPKFSTWVGPDKNVLRELSYDPELSIGGYIGAVYYTSDWGSLTLEVGYQYDATKDNMADYGGEDFLMEDNLNYINIRAGVTVFFGPE